jgi:glycosyltransferase involved in cell wall biosynthesis
MNSPIISIVIPTYNRSAQLQLLLNDLENVLNFNADIEIVVSNNRSTDDTYDILEQFKKKWGDQIVIIHRAINLGMEGNIACSMLDGKGKYIWMLSDHQRLCIPNLKNFIEKLYLSDFDLGYAKLTQWASALDSDQEIFEWGQLNAKQIGSLLFSIGNLSTLVARRDLITASSKEIFKCCAWSYPHLGIISKITPKTRVTEFKDLSSLPAHKHSQTMVHDYNKLLVRFSYNLHCVKLQCKIAKIEPHTIFFFTKDYTSAFYNEILNYLLKPAITKHDACIHLFPVISSNPLKLKLIGLVVLLTVLILPTKFRLLLAQFSKRKIQKYKYSNTKNVASQ